MLNKFKLASDMYPEACVQGQDQTSLEHSNVGEIFNHMKNKFVEYAPFIVYCQNVETKLNELIKIDTRVKEDVDNLQNFLALERQRTKNPYLPASFNALLTCPMQHVLR